MTEPRFTEGLPCAILEEVSGAKGAEWDVVLIQPGWSLNGRYYPADVLRAATPLFEGLKACTYRFGQKFDHLPEQAAKEFPGGLAQNLVGWFENVRFGAFKDRNGKEGEGILARLHVMEGAKWLRENLRDAWAHGKDVLGFSIDARGLAKNGHVGGRSGQIVERIDEVRETTVVTDPAAGGQVLRLVASVGGEVMPKALLEAIQARRPSWFEGFSAPEGDVGDFLIRVLESNLARAETALKSVPNDQVKTLAEVARGINSLEAVLALLKAGKTEDAIKAIQAWISNYPEPAEYAGKGYASYAYPYEHMGAGYPSPKKESAMTDQEKAAAEAAVLAETKKKDEEAAAQAEKDAEKMKEQKLKLARKERDLRVKERILASGLPDKAKARLETLLTSRDGDLSDKVIDAEVEAERTYIASLNEGAGKPAGLGDAHGQSADQVKVMQDQRDKWGKAWDGFFSGGRMVENVQPFRSVHKAFGVITGRYLDPTDMADIIFESIRLAMPSNPNKDFGRHIARLSESFAAVKAGSAVLRESIVTSDFPVTFGQALYRRFEKDYREDPRNDWRKIVSSIENLKDLTNKYSVVRVGGIGTLPAVNQNAPYQELTDPSEQKEEITPGKFGGLLKLTWEDVLADNMGLIRKIPSMLGRAAVRTIHEAVWNIIEANTVIQGNALISAVNKTLVSGSPALAYAELKKALLLLREQTEQDSAKKLGLAPKYLLVGPKLETEAWEICNSKAKINTAEDATVDSVVKSLGIEAFPTLGLGLGAGTDDHWYLAADPNDAETIAVGFLNGRDSPDIFVQSPVDNPNVGEAFSADAMTFKVRLAFGVALVDWRAFAGSLA